MRSAILLICFAYMAQAQKCYWPNGEESGQSPCPVQNGQNATACCGTQTDSSPAWCLTNGLCLSDFKIWRGSCTDPSWGSEACPAQYCAKEGPNGPFQLSQCFNLPNGLTFGCFNCTAENNFAIPPGSFNLSPEQKQALGLVIATSTISVSISSSTTASMIVNSNTSLAALATSNSTIFTSDGTNEDSKPMSLVLEVGLGLGVPLMLSLIVIVWLVVAVRKSRRAPGRYRRTTQRGHQVSTVSQVSVLPAKMMAVHNYSNARYEMPPTVRGTSELNGENAESLHSHAGEHFRRQTNA